MSNKPTARQKIRARLDQNVADARAVRENPRAIGSILRRGFVRLWKLRGGGFYGLGWVICFLWLQFQALSDDVAQAQGIADFASNWLLEKLLTFGLETLINFGLAFAWPGFFIQALGGWGIALFVAGFILIDNKLRPWVLASFPELAVEKDSPTEASKPVQPVDSEPSNEQNSNEESDLNERR